MNFRSTGSFSISTLFVHAQDDVFFSFHIMRILLSFLQAFQKTVQIEWGLYQQAPVEPAFYFGHSNDVISLFTQFSSFCLAHSTDALSSSGHIINASLFLLGCKIGRTYLIPSKSRMHARPVQKMLWLKKHYERHCHLSSASSLKSRDCSFAKSRPAESDDRAVPHTRSRPTGYGRPC